MDFPTASRLMYKSPRGAFQPSDSTQWALQWESRRRAKASLPWITALGSGMVSLAQ